MLRTRDLDVVIASFEGPDGYSLAGGLGVRVRELARALAAAGARTTVVFVGDPSLPPEETDRGVRLVRFAQSVSARHPAGVYQGEEEKVAALRADLPAWIAETVVGPAARRGRLSVVLTEEWQLADTCIGISDALWRSGLRDRAVLLWNANNVYGFERIDWQRLAFVAALTTVSRYMKHRMQPFGVDPMVVPNGIPSEALAPVDEAAVARIRSAAGTPCLAFKIGRFTPDKRWHQAVSAIAELRARGMPARLLLRGGIEPFGGEVLAHARRCGLGVLEWTEPVSTADDVAAALTADPAAVVVLRRFLPDEVVAQIGVAATAVLANSGHEPFGLVGLETMAAGGVAVVGATGEDYARPYGNCIVVETDDPLEVATALTGLVERPDLASRLREAGRRDAAEYAWPLIVEGFVERLRFVAARQRVQLPG